MCIMISCAIFAAKMNMNVVLSLLTLAAGYGLQDLAHYYTGEPTFQGATWGSGTSPMEEAMSLFTMHVYYLLPLILDVASENMRYVVALSPLMVFTYGNYFIDSHCTGIPHTFQKDRMMKGNLSSAEERASLECIRQWAVSQNPPKEKTSHWWVADLGKDAHDAFERIEHSDTIQKIFQERFNKSDGLFSSGYKVDVVRGMNEVYISGPNRKGTSDEVFFTEHIDGPYGFFPFASLYRCILGLDMNTEISTIFTSYEQRETVQTGDFVAFDFHREPHLIAANNNAPNKDYRIVLKLHYVVYPSSMAMFGNMLHWMTVKYNEAFRALFLFTLTPSDPWSAFVGEYLVNGFTKLWNGVHKQIGLANLFYVITALSLAYTLNNSMVMVLLTSYVHYCRYISTYYIRKNVNYGYFKRDAFFFKTVSMIILAYFVFNPILTSKMRAVEFFVLYMPQILLAAFGIFVSSMATVALGMSGTYFGIELGFVKADYQFIKSFPYNIFPHPMILGQVVAFGTLFTIPHMHEGVVCPVWYIPLHIALYLTHMTQEIFDYHDGTPWYKTKSKSE
eukprot:CAMPEP_0116014906 /NCGR_PEP_ID=MMETSP0321-20121206/6528_1 /TAXON_ID=163516 /ORGANISM="Leptocylindrus danicus var. danicus, Strain B650" /LENGTH=561 /DNA_ID=CAMNT_0003484591 /DNA_START=1 /DNA_END=1686 /DNA_ORIENTATION=-